VSAAFAFIVILAFIGLGFDALHKIKPGWLRIRAGDFSIEMGQGSDPPGDRPPLDEHRELEAERDKPRELEAGCGGSEPTGTDDQGNAAALRGPSPHHAPS
jgi:hypothetical protein